MLTDSWRLVSTLNWTGSTQKTLPVALSAQLSSRIIRTKTRANGVPVNWYRAGYLKQVSSVGIGGFELGSFVVPLNAEKIFALTKITSFYQLTFTPVTWLPNGLKIQIYQYTGFESNEELVKEFLFLK